MHWDEGLGGHCEVGIACGIHNGAVRFLSFWGVGLSALLCHR